MNSSAVSYAGINRSCIHFNQLQLEGDLLSESIRRG